jgi:hypothetical protein
MSADNWTNCPKCNQTKNNKIKSLKSELSENYGKISQDEYGREMDKIHGMIDTPSPRTLREDFEIGIYEDEFEVTYGAGCSVCGFSFTFTHSQKGLS